MQTLIWLNTDFTQGDLNAGCSKQSEVFGCKNLEIYSVPLLNFPMIAADHIIHQIYLIGFFPPL